MGRRVSTIVVVALLGALVAPPAGARILDDPYRDRQWALDRLQAEDAWSTTRGAGALVAIVDTGVDLSHPDLRRNIVTAPGSNFVDEDAACESRGKGKRVVWRCAQDRNGHGTHVAGVVAARAHNGIGIAGVAPDAKILPVRVLDKKGEGTTDKVARGIRFAADQGANAINLSLGFMSGEGEVARVMGAMEPIDSAVDYAWDKGAVVVFAAGNDSVPLCAEPAAHPRVMCVGATDRNDVRSWFSNSDATLSKYYVMAPGGDGLRCSSDVLSTYLRSGSHSTCSPGKGYEALSGTSMATPHVSGVAALLAAKGLGNAAIMECIIATADDLGAPGRDPVYGYGRVNARAAVSDC